MPGVVDFVEESETLEIDFGARNIEQGGERALKPYSEALRL